MESFVYFAQRTDTGEIKIGVTCNVRQRIARLKADAPVRLLAHAPGTILDEARMHQRFIRDRADGEWFAPTPQLNETVEYVRDTGELPAHPTQVALAGYQRSGDTIIPIFTIIGPQPIGIAA